MPTFDQSTFASLTLTPGPWKDKEGGRVDIIHVGEPDANLCSFMGTDRSGVRRFYRINGTCPAEPHKSITAIWPADEPDRYQIIQHNPDEDIYRINPLQFADGGQLRSQVPDAKWAVLITRDGDNSRPRVELIEL